MKIFNLYFADDILIILCKGKLNSVIAMVKKCLNQFRDVLGLSGNPNKGCPFTCGVVERFKNQLLGNLGGHEGKLPVRYLGPGSFYFF